MKQRTDLRRWVPGLVLLTTYEVGRRTREAVIAMAIADRFIMEMIEGA